MDSNRHTSNGNGSVATISGGTAPVFLSSAPGVIAGDFVPARVPAWWLYSDTAMLNVEVFVALSADAGGRLELRGQGDFLLGAVDIPTNPLARSGIAKIQLKRRASSSQGRYYVYFNSRLENIFNASSTASLNNSAVRRPTEEVLMYRLVWIPANANQVQIADMETFIYV